MTPSAIASSNSTLPVAFNPSHNAWNPSRRLIISIPLITGSLALSALPSLAQIRPELAPDQSKYNVLDDEELLRATNLFQSALNATTVQEEERLWTRLINKYMSYDALWVPDLVGRAYGNRGNAKSRQGRFDEALTDFNKAIVICPWAPDPLLNRGVIYESMGRFEDAIIDYKSVLDVFPNDASAWNNLGNANMGLSNWSDAANYFEKAMILAPQFSFAAANRAIALYQLGEENRAIKEFRSLLRRYPEGLDDIRAALTAALWAAGLRDAAEGEWHRVDDIRYKDIHWLKEERRWPPKLIESLTAFLEIR